MTWHSWARSASVRSSWARAPMTPCARRTVACVASLYLALPAAAQEAQDYTAVTDQAGTEISAAVPIALGVVGLFVGIMLAYKVLRRMIRA